MHLTIDELTDLRAVLTWATDCEQENALSAGTEADAATMRANAARYIALVSRIDGELVEPHD